MNSALSPINCCRRNNDEEKRQEHKNSSAAFPPGWDEERVRRVLEHYAHQTEEEAVAEDEAAFEAEGQTVMIVPTDIVPEVRKLIAKTAGRTR